MDAEKIIKNNVEHQCGPGTVVYDTYGNEYVMEYESVDSYPNDKAVK